VLHGHVTIRLSCLRAAEYDRYTITSTIKQAAFGAGPDAKKQFPSTCRTNTSSVDDNEGLTLAIGIPTATRIEVYSTLLERPAKPRF
jgi:hypothetical protein